MAKQGPARAAPRAAQIEIQATAPQWRGLRGAAAIAHRAALAALAAAPARRRRGEICVMLADSRTLRRLNRAWRGKDKPTNVLSFPTGDDGGRHRRRGAGAPVLLGDVAIAYQVLAAEAAAQGKSRAHHLTHLVVHGVLHLLGHDHEIDAEAERMEALEVRILRRLGVDDPYRAAA